jgi:uncharacterized protein (TIGR03437 family)
MRWLCVTVLLSLTCLARAGTTVIHVDTECCGDVVDTAHNVVNQKGAIFWNGTKWVSNDTAAHMYFTDLRTGERLMNYITTLFQGSSAPATSTYQNYAVERTLYTYEKTGTSGKYRFTAAQFRIRNTNNGKQYLARSRGTAAGTANAFFDIYLTDEDGSTTAVRGDPAWFNYAMSLDQAVLQTSTTANKMGDFPTAGGSYFFDIDGGSDMGGRSFQFHTSALAVADPALSLGSAFATDFSVKYMDTANNLQELKFLPYAEGTFTPNTPNLPLIAGVISAGAFGGFSAIAPGSWIEIYGTNLAATSRAWADADFNGVKAPTALSGTKVTIGSQDAVLSYISPGQMNAQVPGNVTTGQRPITVTTAVGTSPSYTVTVNARQPGLFAHPAFIIGGKQHIGAVYSNDGNTFVMPTGAVGGITSRPAKPGDTILLFGIGFGAVTPGAWAGEVAQQQSAIVEPVTIYVNQVEAKLLYAGLVPCAVGLYQFNMVVPNVAAADAVPLTFSQGGVAGTQTLYMAVGK